MKYCPHCGTELSEDSASFCPNCGKETNHMQKKKRGKQKKTQKHKAKKRKQKKNTPIPEIMGEPVDDGYDGYYDDILPPDMDRIGEGMDKALVKQIVLLLAGTILVIGACIAMMYLL